MLQVPAAVFGAIVTVLFAFKINPAGTITPDRITSPELFQLLEAFDLIYHLKLMKM